MKVIRYFTVVPAAMVLWLVMGAQRGGEVLPAGPDSAAGVVASQPAGRLWPAATTSTAPGAEDFEQVRARAFKHLLKGQFSRGAALLDAAGALGADVTVAKARALTAEYLKVRAEYEAERKAELATAVNRVRLARLAQEYRPKLVEAKLAEKLWDRVKAVADAVGAADEFLATGSTSRPAEVRDDAFGHLDRAAKEIASTDSLAADLQGDWADAFKASLRRFRRSLGAYRQSWRDAGQSDDRHGLKDASRKVQDALIDVSVLVSRQPLTAALNYALEAKELTGETEGFLCEKWVKELIRDADKRGRRLVDDGKWVKALMIYGHSGLSRIDEDNTVFESMLKKANRHVRVLSLYGRNGLAGVNGNGSTETPTSRPAATTRPIAPAPAAPANNMRWRDMIVGIDTAMVRKAIEEIGDNFVREPDYRKIGVAGLNGVKVLLENRQAAETFSDLKDDKKRQAFLKGIDRKIEFLRGLEAVDYLHVTDVLNHLLDLNAETVDLPDEVVNMEFAEGMLTALDRFTSMIWPYEEEEFRKRTMGSFYGIGVQIRKEPGKAIEVVTPLADTPAFRAGIRAGDYITRVGKRETRMMELQRVVKLISGRRGTKVTLTIRRAGRSKPFEVSITRDRIHIQTIKGWRLLPDGAWDFLIDPDDRIGYIRLTQFTADTVKELRRALHGLMRRDGQRQPARGVIIDMRFNPGGLLTAAVDVADEFLPRGLIVRTVRRDEAQSEKIATALGECQHARIVVLVNQYSASAAEIVAGALKDWGRARIVGRRTYGKGSVQRLLPLGARRAKLKLTTAYYYLPSGRCLHRTNGAKVWGVDPDVPVKITVRQTNRWAEIRHETDLLKSVDAGRLSGLLIRQLREDIQLQTALLLLRLNFLADARPAPAAKAA